MTDSLVVEYEYVVPARTHDKHADLEAQVHRFASRVEQLWRQRAGLVALLRSIKKHGGVTDRDWRAIDRILASGRWTDDEDSGRH